MSKTYGLYPFTWHPPVTLDLGLPTEITVPGYHSPPEGSLCVLDLRNLSAQGLADSTEDQFGFFAWDDGVQTPGDLITLGVGDCREIVATPTMANEIKLKLGLSTVPVGTYLIDLLYDVLGPLSDPDGSSGVRPLMPTRSNDLEIHLAGHSLVYTKKFIPAQLLANNPVGHYNRIRQVIRGDLTKAHGLGGDVLAGKVLGGLLLRYGYSISEVAAGSPGKAAEWRRLLTPALQARQNMKPRLPSTSYTETWPNATSDIEGTSQDQSWVTVTNTLAVVSGKLRCTTNFSNHTATCSSAVSSDNHVVTLLISAYGQPMECGPSARASDSVDTFYCYECVPASPARRLAKFVTGTRTQITTDTLTFSAGDTFEVECDGSTLTGRNTQNSDRTTTDTSITGNLKGGIRWFADTNAHSLNECDTWTITDLVTSFTATSAVSLGALTTSISGTFTKPTYTGTASLSLPALTESSSGTFTKPTFTATTDVTLGAQTLSSSATFLIVDRTATAAVSFAPLIVSSSGTVTQPVYTATASLAIPSILTSVSGTFTSPTYTASASLSLGPVVSSSTGTFAVHTYTATANLSLGGLTSSATGTFITVSTGTASLSTGAVTLQGSGTFTAPVYTASLAASCGALTLTASATFQTMSNEGTASLTFAPLTTTGVATHQPVYVATSTLTFGALTVAGVAWLNPPVFYLEWSDSGESTVVDRLEGSSVLTETITGDCTVIDTITGSLRLRLTTTP